MDPYCEIFYIPTNFRESNQINSGRTLDGTTVLKTQTQIYMTYPPVSNERQLDFYNLYLRL